MNDSGGNATVITFLTSSAEGRKSVCLGLEWHPPDTLAELSQHLAAAPASRALLWSASVVAGNEATVVTGGGTHQPSHQGVRGRHGGERS